MQHTVLAFDTNIWIYLAKPSYDRFYQQLRKLVEEGNLEIIVNDVVKLEWTRNKQTTIKTISENIKNEYFAALNLTGYIPDAEKREQFSALLSEYRKEASRLESATNRVEEVEQFMNSCIHVNVTDEQKLYIANMAMEKQPPFENNKNNFNDALLVRNFAQYMTERIIYEGSALPQKYDIIYVSNNQKDFTDAEGNIYPAIIAGCDNVRFCTVKDLAKAIHEKDELIEDFDDWLEAALDNWMALEVEIAMGK